MYVIKLQSVQLLKVVVLLLHQIRYFYSEIPWFMKHLVLYGKVIKQQTFVEDELKLTIL